MRSSIHARVALLVSFVATAASAQTPDAIKEADRRFEEGKRLFAEGKFEEARTRFAEACAAHRTENCPKNLGLAEHRLAMYPEAATHLREFLEDARTQGDPLRAQVDERFKECRAKVGELDIAAPPGSKVRLDDKVDLGRGPLTHTTFVAPGKHFVVAIWSDGQKAEDVSVEAGKTAKVDLLVASAGSGDGHGGHDVPPPATYRSVRPAAGWAIPFVLGGLAAGAFGVAVGFGLLSSGAASDAKMYAAVGPCGATGAWCGEGQAAAASANDKATVSAVFYVASGVLAAAAVTTFFAWPKTRIEVTPTMGPTGGGAVLRASF